MQTIPKTPTIFFTILTLLLASLTITAFAAPVSVMTDKDSYNSGEAISVSGTAASNAYVSIQLYDPNDMRKAIA
jgi:hypothetical protein